MDEPEKEPQPLYGAFEPELQPEPEPLVQPKRMRPPYKLREYMPYWAREWYQKLRQMLSGFASWFCILSGVAVVCGLFILVPALWMLDGPSYQYLRTLSRISWRIFLGGLGTTTKGFISSPSVSILSGFVALLIIFAVRGAKAVVKHWQENVVIVFAAVAIGYAAVYGSSFVRIFLNTIHKQQAAITTELDTAKHRITELEDTIKIKRHNADFTDTAFQNAMGTLRAFMAWRKAIGPDAKCRILITEPPPTDRTQTISAFYGVLIETAVDGSNCPNGNLQNIGLNPLEAEREEQKGLIPGVAIIHMPVGAKGSSALETSLANLFQTKRSYTLPRKTDEEVIWIQIGPNVMWNSELFSKDRP